MVEIKVEVKDYGKDHWSLLAYLETLVVDGATPAKMTAKIDAVKMRCNIGKNGHLADFRQTRPWKKEWGTRLVGYFKDGDNDETRRLDEHDDWDCLEDLEEAGFIEVLSLANFFFKMEIKGMKIAAQIRSHKAGGGVFATFVPNDV